MSVWTNCVPHLASNSTPSKRWLFEGGIVGEIYCSVVERGQLRSDKGRPAAPLRSLPFTSTTGDPRPAGLVTAPCETLDSPPPAFLLSTAFDNLQAAFNKLDASLCSRSPAPTELELATP